MSWKPNGSMLVSEFGNNRALLINMTTKLGVPATASPSLNRPGKAIFDPITSNLYVIDRSNRMLVWSNGSTTNGTVLFRDYDQMILKPSSFYLDAQNNFYIVDSGHHRILFWPNNAARGTPIAGNGGNLDWPTSVFVDEVKRQMYVASYGNHRIVRYDIGNPNGTIVAGTDGQGNMSK
jgi:DNA-binding beta-propeller fold protein YncE